MKSVKHSVENPTKFKYYYVVGDVIVQLTRKGSNVIVGPRLHDSHTWVVWNIIDTKIREIITYKSR